MRIAFTAILIAAATIIGSAVAAGATITQIAGAL